MEHSSKKCDVIYTGLWIRRHILLPKERLIYCFGAGPVCIVVWVDIFVKPDHPASLKLADLDLYCLLGTLNVSNCRIQLLQYQECM